MTEFDDVRRMVDLMSEHGLEEFELEREGVRIRLRRPSSGGTTRGHEGVADTAAAPAAAPVSPAVEETGDGLVLVRSPIVGTFYRSAEPDAAPFVDVGAAVQKGQTLCIIEAMKLMNEIDAELDGEIVTVFFDNGQPVQYGDTLFAIKPA